jgi:replication factor C subunit 1
LGGKRAWQERVGMYFINQDMVPLYVHENYLQVMGGTSVRDLEGLARVTGMMSKGDVAYSQVRLTQDYSLLPSVSILTCVAPSIYTTKPIIYPKFPDFLGKFSSSRKFHRLVREVSECLSYSLGSTSPSFILQEFTPLLFSLILSHLKLPTKPNLLLACHLLDSYNISMNIFKDNILLMLSTKFSKKWGEVETKVKTAFTR